MAIATGTYDGGWMFEGELLLWNWTENSWREPVSQIPEVVWVNFDPEGATLDLIVRPWDEEWGGDPNGQEDDAFTRFYGANTIADWNVARSEFVLDPAARLGDDKLKILFAADESKKDAHKSVAAWLKVPKLIERSAIWDLSWLGDDKIASVSNECLLQIDDLTGTKLSYVEGDGYGAAIVSSEPPLIHVAQRRIRSDSEVSSRLLAIQDGALVELGTYAGSYSFTGSSNGTVLGRLVRHHRGSASSDLLIDVATGVGVPINLGHYDCFNHFVGIDGAPANYFLQATPPDGHERKRLCRLDAHGNVESLWPVLDQDGSQASHAMECYGCFLDDSAGAGIVLAGKHYDPNPSAPIIGFIYRKSLNADRELWRHPTTAASSAIVYVESLGIIAAAFLDGTLRLIDAITGAVRAAGRVTIGAQPTVIFSLSANGYALAIGTMDGRVAVLEPGPLLASDATVGRIELA
ncbi:hypothetical protein EWE75_24045 [Sphingomonas populi]|uniref:WD40 repeat domain-containing protein n=1 Tax=Sphingomonas populi TaxID=2484750 RepID=A0A4Q6XQT6_9SPHN|nr:hypothetical protein EWE75_24045 [Sphingomonas populi]